MTPRKVRSGHFDWSNFRALVEKAERDLATLRSGPEQPLDVIFNLVTTIDHIWDWVINDDSLTAEEMQKAKDLRKSNPAVSVIHSLSGGAKHLKIDRAPVAKTETIGGGWGEMPWGDGPWGGGFIYRVEVAGSMRDVADVAAEALAAWHAMLG